MPARTSPEVVKKIIALHCSGLPRARIADRVDCGYETVRTTLQQNGIVPNPGAKTPALVQEKMVKLYQSGLSANAAAKSVGLTEAACLGALRRRDIKRRRQGSPRIYQLDESFFDVIDTEEKAYWLGFLVADGGISAKSVHLSLAAVDAPHILKLRAALCSEHPLKWVRSKTGYGVCTMPRISFCSKRLVKALAKYYVTARKSHTVRPPDKLPADLWRHYYRGFFDGDGCITTTTNHAGNHWAISIAGNSAMTEAMRVWFSTQDLDLRPARPHVGGLFNLRCGGNKKALRLLRLLYEDSTVWLDRKYALFLAACKGPPQARGRQAAHAERGRKSG